MLRTFDGKLSAAAYSASRVGCHAHVRSSVLREDLGYREHGPTVSVRQFVVGCIVNAHFVLKPLDLWFRLRADPTCEIRPKFQVKGHRGEDLRGRQEAARADGREPALQRGDTTSRPISFFFLE